MATAKATLPGECVRPDGRTVAALRGHADLAETMRRFATALHDQVFVQSVDCDAKDRLKHQKILLRTDSYLVLQVIWKESAFITDDELRAARLAREFGGCALNCHALGVQLALSKEDVGRSNTRVGTIITAAEVYDLVSRDDLRTKLRPILGTALLHSIMIEIIQPLQPHPVAPIVAVNGLEAQ